MTISFSGAPRHRRPRSGSREPTISIVLASAIVPLLAIVALGLAALVR